MLGRLRAARIERDRVEAILAAASAKRPPVPEPIRDPKYPDLYLGSEHWFRLGDVKRAKMAKAYAAEVEAVDAVTNHDRLDDLVGDACGGVSNIESEMIAFEPRSMADLRILVELALHQESVDGGIHDGFLEPLLRNVLRLTAQSLTPSIS